MVKPPPLTHKLDAGISNYITHKLVSAANLTSSIFPVTLNHDEIYEELIGRGPMLDALDHAIKYLPRDGYSGDRRATFADQSIVLHLTLLPTGTRRVFLMPEKAHVIHSESRLGRELWPAVKLAYEWKMLHHAWTQISAGKDVRALKIAFPWIRDILASPNAIARFKGRQEKYQLKWIADHAAPDRCLSMGAALSNVCASGGRLLAQHNMVAAATERTVKAPVYPVWGNMPVLPWLSKAIEETNHDWETKQSWRS